MAATKTAPKRTKKASTNLRPLGDKVIIQRDEGEGASRIEHQAVRLRARLQQDALNDRQRCWIDHVEHCEADRA